MASNLHRRMLLLCTNSHYCSAFTGVACHIAKNNLSIKPHFIIFNIGRHYAQQMGRSNLGLSIPRRFGRENEVVPKDNRSLTDMLFDGLDVIRDGIQKFTEENKTIYAQEYDFMFLHNDFKYFVKFNEHNIKKWSVTADSDTGDGKSTAELRLTPNGTALFCGNLNTELIQDGVSKMAGHCNISSPLNIISFDRLKPYDWRGFTHLNFRIRGDGRNYMVNVQRNWRWRHHQGDMYNYPLYTHGGPYWQEVSIPFSKFFFSSLGRMQDVQHHIDLCEVRDLGITLADGQPGPFRLEIDYIALVRDLNATQHDFDMEMYQRPSLDW